MTAVEVHTSYRARYMRLIRLTLFFEVKLQCKQTLDTLSCHIFEYLQEGCRYLDYPHRA
jgi:hypothetical protein